jgi:rRNA maturation protein Nop10
VLGGGVLVPSVHPEWPLRGAYASAILFAALFALMIQFIIHENIARARALRLARTAHVRWCKGRGASSEAWATFKPRIDWWRARFAESQPFGANDGAVLVGSYVLYAFTVLVLVVVIPGRWAPGWPMLFLFLLCMLAPSLAVSQRAKRRGRRTLNEGDCPECGYNLVGSIPAFADQTSIGPERCPECGYDWPFVPPPIPREFACASAPDHRGGSRSMSSNAS